MIESETHSRDEPPFWQCASILANEHDEVLYHPIRHFNEIRNASQVLIVSAQIIDLPGKIDLSRQVCSAFG